VPGNVARRSAILTQREKGAGGRLFKRVGRITRDFISSLKMWCEDMGPRKSAWEVAPESHHPPHCQLEMAYRGSPNEGKRKRELILWWIEGALSKGMLYKNGDCKLGETVGSFDRCNSYYFLKGRFLGGWGTKVEFALGETDIIIGRVPRWKRNRYSSTRSIKDVRGKVKYLAQTRKRIPCWLKSAILQIE